MLISDTHIVCTPVKTGTESLQRTLRDHMEVIPNPKHDPLKLSGNHEHLICYTVMRDPWDRLLSMFCYLRKLGKKGNGLIGLANKVPFEIWLEHFMHLRREYCAGYGDDNIDWRVSQVEHQSHCKLRFAEVRVVALPNIQHIVDVIAPGLTIKHTNRSRTASHAPEPVWNDVSRGIAQKYIEEDLEAYTGVLSRQ